MSRSTNLFTGLFASFAVSCLALVLTPQSQIGVLQPNYTEDEGKITDIYPIDSDGVAQQGRQIYIREGCMYCHSQQVRDPHMGTDIMRGWGERRTVARDYLYQTPALLGSQRIGPDLTNTGSGKWRNEAENDTRKPTKRDAAWHLLHMYHPQTVITESNHPPYRYLFESRKITGQKSADALVLTGEQMPLDGYEVVPTPAAKALVGYILSLNRTHELPEAKPVSAGVTTTAGSPSAAPAAPSAAK